MSRGRAAGGEASGRGAPPRPPRVGARPDDLGVNASGQDQARGAGLALHLGAAVLPPIGLTHRPLVAQGRWLEDAAGAWTPALLPWLADRLWTVGQPVLHFRPDNPEDFEGVRFPVWGADISNSGWYGFPLSRDGVVKIGHHGAGTVMHPDAERRIPDGHEERCREFLCGTFPTLADARLVGSRVCLYCDSFDGNFLIDGDPDHPGLIVAAGGSGHGFKFAPVLGGLIADVVEGVENRWAPRFAWRSLGTRAAEQARYLPGEP